MPSLRLNSGLAVLVVMACLLAASPALAHKVYVYAWVEGDRIHVDGYFSRSRKVQGGLVEVFGPDGAKLLEGKTDDQGAFSFKIPQKADLKIVLTASMGHKNDYTIRADELPAGSAASSPARVQARPTAKAGAESAAASAETPAAPVAPEIDEARLRALLDQALDRKLEPLMRAVAQANEPHGPGLTEILGGLGYIVGIMGIVLYLRSRGKQ